MPSLILESENTEAGKSTDNVNLTWRVPELRNALQRPIASSLRSLLLPHLPTWYLHSYTLSLSPIPRPNQPFLSNIY